MWPNGGEQLAGSREKVTDCLTEPDESPLVGVSLRKRENKLNGDEDVGQKRV